MKQEALSSFDMPWLPVMALIMFIVAFGFYFWWAYKKSHRPHFDDMSMIPLEDAKVKRTSI